MELNKGKELVNENKGQPRMRIIALTTVPILTNRLFSPHKIGANWGKKGRDTGRSVNWSTFFFLGEEIFKKSQINGKGSEESG